MAVFLLFPCFGAVNLSSLLTQERTLLNCSSLFQVYPVRKRLKHLSASSDVSYSLHQQNARACHCRLYPIRTLVFHLLPMPFISSFLLRCGSLIKLVLLHVVLSLLTSAAQTSNHGSELPNPSGPSAPRFVCAPTAAAAPSSGGCHVFSRTFPIPLPSTITKLCPCWGIGQRGPHAKGENAFSFSTVCFLPLCRRKSSFIKVQV